MATPHTSLIELPVGRRYRQVVSITVIATLAVMVDYYTKVLPGWSGFDRTILYFVIPMAWIVFVFRARPADYGFQLGDWRAGVAITAVSLALVLPVLWFVVRADARLSARYQALLDWTLPAYVFLDLFGWEFLFRGWMLFGYTREFGPAALWLQAALFGMAHLGKPEVEAFSTILGGFAFGWIAYRTRSFLYPFLIHWAVFCFVVLVAGGALD